MTERSVPRLKRVIDEYMRKVAGIDTITERCLKTERWDGKVVLMVIDAAFTSVGLNYFTAVVPKVVEFDGKYVKTGRISNLLELADSDTEGLRHIWKNRRSWELAKGVASYLAGIGRKSDRQALRFWAKNAPLEGWESDPVGKLRGVGLVTYQYLRMMGGVDTVMPDKIVKRVINEIFILAGVEPADEDMEFIGKSSDAARLSGYRPIELCWMTWLVQSEGKMMRMEKYSKVLSKI